MDGIRTQQNQIKGRYYTYVIVLFLPSWLRILDDELNRKDCLEPSKIIFNTYIILNNTYLLVSFPYNRKTPVGLEFSSICNSHGWKII